jgi:HPt (histidine-containing phosphotransfer) domain-containing protein
MSRRWGHTGRTNGISAAAIPAWGIPVVTVGAVAAGDQPDASYVFLAAPSAANPSHPRNEACAMTQVTNGTELVYSTLGGDPDLSEIVALFVAEIPGRVATLLAKLDAGDWEGLRRTAHQLRGAAGSYGFDPLTPSVARLEDATGQHAPEQEIRAAVDSLVALCSRVCAGTPR